MMGHVMKAVLCACMLFQTTAAQDQQPVEDLAKLPGGTMRAQGDVQIEEYELGDGPVCEKGTIVVPENRRSESSRNIELYFYRLKARNPSGHAPVFMLPGGPGGFYNDDWVNGLKTEPARGSNAEAWRYTQDRDVVLVNQRGARFPDRRYQWFGFLMPARPLDQPFSVADYTEQLQESLNGSIERFGKQGMDLAGYDIMNMVDDINDLRKALGYEKITLRGTSFGSQWSFSYMRQCPQHVDRAVLSGTEPIDYGYDSPQGAWNVYKRLEDQLAEDDGFPDVPLTDAIKQVVERLEEKPATVTDAAFNTDVAVGVEDFRRHLRGGIAGRRESVQSRANFPKYIYEMLDGDFRYLASKLVSEKSSFGGNPLQIYLIDNSLGISALRDKQLNEEPPTRWLGEQNLMYKASRDVTPTPVVSDEFRALKTDTPVLLVHGDLDLATPIENAFEAMDTMLSNAHLIQVKGGTHGAFDQIMDHNPEFKEWIAKFLAADLETTKVAELELPSELSLPALEFAKMTGPSLFEKTQN